MPAQSISLDNAYNAKLRQMLYDLEHVDIIKHQPEMLGGGSHEYQRYVLSGNSGQYPPVHMLAEYKAMGGALLMEREIGGAMPKKRVKKAVKKMVKKVVKEGSESESDEEKMGGKISRMKKAKKWTDYAEDTAKKALGLAEMAKAMGGKVSRMKKAKKWTNYAEDTAKKALGLAEMAKAVGGAKRPPSERASIVKKVMAEKGISMIQASKYVKEHGLYKPK